MTKQVMSNDSDPKNKAMAAEDTDTTPPYFSWCKSAWARARSKLEQLRYSLSMIVFGFSTAILISVFSSEFEALPNYIKLSAIVLITIIGIWLIIKERGVYGD